MERGEAPTGITFGRKARVHRPAAVAGRASLDEYVTIGRKTRLHLSAVVAVAVNKNTSPDGRRSTPSSGCGGGSSCQRILDSLRVVHGIAAIILEFTLEILLGDDSGPR